MSLKSPVLGGFLEGRRGCAPHRQAQRTLVSPGSRRPAVFHARGAHLESLRLKDVYQVSSARDGFRLRRAMRISAPGRSEGGAFLHPRMVFDVPRKPSSQRCSQPHPEYSGEGLRTASISLLGAVRGAGKGSPPREKTPEKCPGGLDTANRLS